MRVALLAAAFALASSLPALAQDAPAFDVSGGYSFLRDEAVAENLYGWTASVTMHLNRWLGITGEVGSNYKTEHIFATDLALRTHAFLAGPRFSFRQSARVTPSAHVLMGAARTTGRILGETDSVTEFAIQPGGSVEFWMGSNVGLSVGGDYRRVLADEPTNLFRFVAGIVVRGPLR